MRPDRLALRRVAAPAAPALGTRPRRIVELIRSVDSVEGNGGVVQSICQADLSPALMGVVNMVVSRIE